MSEIAKQRLRLINMNQSEMIIEDKNGMKMFNISGEAAARQGKSALEEALFIREQTRAADNEPFRKQMSKRLKFCFRTKKRTPFPVF